MIALMSITPCDNVIYGGNEEIWNIVEGYSFSKKDLILIREAT